MISQFTVVFLLYNARNNLPKLISSLRKQIAGRALDQIPFEVEFVDDQSTDDTVSILRTEIADLLLSEKIRIFQNTRNLGLAGSVNAALGRATTPFVVTNHCDCYPQTENYYERLYQLISSNPDAAVIIGKPWVNTADLNLVDQINIVGNLMDVLSYPNETELNPTMFAEGRCDIFRISALKQVNFYDSTLRTSGEDQVLASKLRKMNFKFFQASQLRYEIGLSSEQDSLIKLIRHSYLFGKTQAFVLLNTDAALESAKQEKIGRNRTLRKNLRILQIFSGTAFLTGAATACHLGSIGFIPFIVITFGKLLIAKDYFGKGLLNWKSFSILVLIQPILDAAYCWGVLIGLVQFIIGKHKRGGI